MVADEDEAARGAHRPEADGLGHLPRLVDDADVKLAAGEQRVVERERRRGDDAAAGEGASEGGDAVGRRRQVGGDRREKVRVEGGVDLGARPDAEQLDVFV